MCGITRRTRRLLGSPLNFKQNHFVDHSVKRFFCYLLAIFPVLNLRQSDFYLNNDQPAQPPGGRIAHQQMISRIANKFQAKSFVDHLVIK
jgi:hypothetical protein